MRIVGTAGHVDHGKSRLVLALTGINPDRLQEEQDRQMTIDLGFAWMALPNGDPIGIIDVPGHRDFIENMLAGIGGIDAVLFVVATDEGVMPQTKEHLAILDLLEVRLGVVALTKVDLVEDPDWLGLVKEDIAQRLQTTNLAEAPMVPVSAVTGQGLDDLLDALVKILENSPQRRDIGRPRLSVDRAFTISGFGTVVTGTLMDGSLEVGQAVEILPKRLKARIRGLQTHKSKIERAVPGSRVAANLTGVEVRQLSRGDVVVLPDTLNPTRLIDVRFRLLPEDVSKFRHDVRVKLFIGAAQRMARVRLLGMDLLNANEEGWLQLALDKPVVAARGDHFILRRPSPSTTIGGGQVADPHPPRRHRRKDMGVQKRLERLLQGSPGQVLAQTLNSLGPTVLKSAVDHARLDHQVAERAIEELLQLDELIVLEDGTLSPTSKVLVANRSNWEGLLERFRKILSSFHKDNPLRLGMLREELKSRMRLQSRIFNAVIKAAVHQRVVCEVGSWVQLPDYQIVLNEAQVKQIDGLLSRFKTAPYRPPSVKECVHEVGNDLFSYLLDSGRLIKLSPDVVFETETYKLIETAIHKILRVQGTIKIAKVRDHFETSRKYALALMEYMDSIGITVREGDTRRLA